MTCRGTARKFVAYGDALFAEQRFHAAVQRYKSAITAAPDLPETYYHQAFALVAIKQYSLAARALRIGVELDADLLRGGNLLATLYGDNHLVRTAHLEQLADHTLANPGDGDLYFLVGAFLMANGEGERAQRFLQKAADLAPPGSTLLDPLLAPVPRRPGELLTEWDT